MDLDGLRQGLGDRAIEGEPLSKHTTFGIGGPADLFVVAHSIDELLDYASLAWQHRVPYLILGSGANLLVADRGYRGLVIRNACAAVDIASDDGDVTLVTAESGAEMKAVARRAMSCGLAGLEWAVDVPGTVGGAVVGNAGAYGGYVSDTLHGVSVFTPTSGEAWWTSSELKLGYRTSVFKGALKDEAFRPVILSATFALRREDIHRIEERAKEYQLRRAASQPKGRSAGSVFKRTEQYPAGFLIENAGLKGKRVGGAVISPKHANFIINVRMATARDVQELMALVQETVRREFGITLEPEIELVGDW